MDRKKGRQCEYCAGRVHPRRVTDEHWSRGRLVIIEGVPVGVCDRCGERYYKAEVLEAMERIAAGREKIKRKIQVPVAKFRLPA